MHVAKGSASDSLSSKLGYAGDRQPHSGVVDEPLLWTDRAFGYSMVLLVYLTLVLYVILELRHMVGCMLHSKLPLDHGCEFVCSLDQDFFSPGSQTCQIASTCFTPIMLLNIECELAKLYLG